MKVLIDTHYLIWCLADTKKLTKKERVFLASVEVEIYVSAVSVWEISLKSALGKISLKNIKASELPGHILKSGYEVLSLNIDEAASFSQIPLLKNKDPFDRMLINQAIYNDLYFMSRDSEIAEYEQYGLKRVRL